VFLCGSQDFSKIRLKLRTFGHNTIFPACFSDLVLPKEISNECYVPDKKVVYPKHSNLNSQSPSVKHQPRSKRFYFDVGLGSVCLSGIDTGGAYCLLEVSLAAGMGVPRHTHTREDEVYFVLAGELEVTVGEKTFVLRPGDTLLAPRDIPHQLRNSGDTTNHYLLVFSPSGFEEFIIGDVRSRA